MSLLVLIGVIIVIGYIAGNLYLAVSGFLIGILFLFLVQRKFKKVIIDERVENISGNAAKMVYQYTTLLFGLIFVFFILSGQQHDDAYLESLGVLFGYIAMFNISLYAVFFHYFNKKYGGNSK